jgi:hypothetical protein
LRLQGNSRFGDCGILVHTLDAIQRRDIRLEKRPKGDIWRRKVALFGQKEGEIGLCSLLVRNHYR